MALFAKILLFFNLVAGGAFVYFAIEDWNYRQTAAASLLRHQLILVGLPLDGPEIPSEPDPVIPLSFVSPAGATTESVSEEFLSVYLAPGRGGEFGKSSKDPSKPALASSQVGELKRVRPLVLAKINASNKAFGAAHYLMPLADSAEERAKIAQLKQEGKGDELVSMYMAKFDDVESPTGTKDEAERRMRIAQLLINLDPESAWQTRVGLIIGLREYRGSLNLQSKRFEQIASHIRRLIDIDQQEYNKKLRTLEEQAIILTEKLTDSEQRKSNLAEQETRDTEHRDQILTQVNKLTALFAKKQADVNDLLLKQGEAEKKLFEYQRMLGATLEDIFKLEEDLTRRENDRLGVRP